MSGRGWASAQPRLIVNRGSFITQGCSHTESYSENAGEYRNLSWDVEQAANHAAVQLSRIGLVLMLGPKAGNAPPLVVGVELELQADRVLNAAHETHAGVGLLFHGGIYPPGT